MAATGRATFPVTLGTTEKSMREMLPPDIEVIDVSEDAVRGQTYVTVEAERLPAWTPGVSPWNFRTMKEMFDYRRGNHGGVSYT